MAARRKPSPQPLSRPRILEAALRLVEHDGLEAFSMRRLGTALGREAMSLYHFFPSKQHLVDAMVDHAIASIAFPPEDMPPVDRLREVMRAYRAMAHRYPALYGVVGVHRLNTETGVTFIERVLRIAREITGDDESAARHFRVLGYYLMGVALDETRGYAKGPSAAEPVADAFVAEHCPQLARSARYFQRSEWDATFELGLAEMLAAFTRGR
jgi:AcrR family transcriptional regulator